MDNKRTFYLVMMVVGTVGPWFYFAQFFADTGLGMGGFIAALFVNDASGGATVDLVLSSLVFWVWSFADARGRGVRHWWIVVPANLAIGLSLALPLYLWMRSGVNEVSSSA